MSGLYSPAQHCRLCGTQGCLVLQCGQSPLVSRESRIMLCKLGLLGGTVMEVSSTCMCSSLLELMCSSLIGVHVSLSSCAFVLLDLRGNCGQFGGTRSRRRGVLKFGSWFL